MYERLGEDYIMVLSVFALDQQFLITLALDVVKDVISLVNALIAVRKVSGIAKLSADDHCDVSIVLIGVRTGVVITNRPPGTATHSRFQNSVRSQTRAFRQPHATNFDTSFYVLTVLF